MVAEVVVVEEGSAVVVVAEAETDMIDMIDTIDTIDVMTTTDMIAMIDMTEDLHTKIQDWLQCI